MKKNLILIAVLIALGAVYCINLKRPSYKEDFYEDTGVKVKYLTGDMLQFVKENYPQEFKRLFVYVPVVGDMSCPYARAFAQNLKQAKLNPAWTSAYHFMPYINSVTGSSSVSEVKQKIKQIQKFMETVCGAMCIIDTQEDWVFAIQREDSIPFYLEMFRQ